MKRKILYSVVTLFVLFFLLLKSGLFYIGVSPYAHYRLNENESKLFDDAISRFREKVEGERFDEIKNELADGLRSKDEIVAEIKKSRRKFGKPVFTEFFRAMPPEPASKYYKNLNGTFYTVRCFTNSDDGDFFPEQFDWIVKDNSEVQLLNYSASHIRDWELQARETERRLREFSNEIRIPFGSRFIEIRY